MDNLERDAQLEEVIRQNARLQQLIDVMAQLGARSREVLRRQRREDTATAGDGKPDPDS